MQLHYIWFEPTPKGVPSEPLFSIWGEKRKQNLSLSRHHFSKQVKEVVRECGHKGADFGTHNARIGGATRLLAAGASSHLVRLAGRWRSDTWRIYSRFSRSIMMGVSTDMAGAKVVPKHAEGFYPGN